MNTGVTMKCLIMRRISSSNEQVVAEVVRDSEEAVVCRKHYS